MSHDTSVGRCYLCGRPLAGGVCPHCDRRRDGWAARVAALLRLHDDFWLPVLAILSVGVAIALIVVASVRLGSEVGASTSPAAPRSSSPTTSATPESLLAPAASTFWVVGAGSDESGGRPRLGYAFVVHTGADSSDLLTDYDLVVGPYVRGDRTVDLERGQRTFTATIVAVSPDPHVALLRISGRFPALPIAVRPPHPGDTVVFGEDGTVPAPRATVVAHSEPGGRSHLTFSLAVGGSDDGAPVLNLAGRVVGVAEPSAPFSTDSLGFAIPIVSACLTVQAC